MKKLLVTLKVKIFQYRIVFNLMHWSHCLSKLDATTIGRNALKACKRFGLVYQFNKNSTKSQHRDLTKEIARTNIPWFLMKPRSASSLWHISQVKHCGCQVDIMALMTRPMMNSPEKLMPFVISMMVLMTSVSVTQASSPKLPYPGLSGSLCTIYMPPENGLGP